MAFFDAQWVKLLGAASLLCAAASCTRVNPAFQDEAGTSGETRGETLGETTVADATDTQADSNTDSAEGTSSVSSSDSTSLDDTEDTSGTGVPECLLPWTDPLYFKYYDEFDPGGGCGAATAGFFIVRGMGVGNRLSVDPCGVDCEGCADTALAEIEIYPVDLTQVASEITGQCVYAQWDGLLDAQNDHCTYDKFMMNIVEGAQYPVIIGSSGDGSVPTFANLAVGGLEPLLVVDEACDCGDGTDPCCDLSKSPTLYAFDVNDGPAVYVGEQAPVTVPAGEFDFHAVQAQEQDSCGAGLRVSWLMVAAGMP